MRARVTLKDGNSVRFEDVKGVDTTMTGDLLVVLESGATYGFAARAWVEVYRSGEGG